MSLVYEELEGSPSFTMDREGGSGRRIIKIAWSDIGRAILEVFPGALFGYPYTAAMPGFAWLRASRMSIDPFDPAAMFGTNQSINTYKSGAKVTIDYTPYKWPDQSFKDGPEGANSDIENVVFLEQKINFGGEYLTFPNTGVRWNMDGDGVNTFSPGGGGGGAGDKKFQVFENINVGIIIPTIEHTMTWNYVSYPPWSGIRNCLGKVNNAVHMGCYAETLLFNGCSAERTYSTTGGPTWKIEYRISEKCYNYPIPVQRGLSSFTIFQAGTGYNIGDNVTFVGGIGSTAGVTVTGINGTGGITAGIVQATGSYTTIPTRLNTVFGGAGKNAILFGTFNANTTPAAQGWNHFFRPDGKGGGDFQRLVRKKGGPIYQLANFGALYGLTS